MTTEPTPEANKPEVKEDETLTVLEAFDRLQALRSKVDLDINVDEIHSRETNPIPDGKKEIESMNDLTPEDRARQMRFAEKLRELAGKIHLEIDLDELRGRR